MIVGMLFSRLSVVYASQSVLHVCFTAAMIVNDWFIAESSHCILEQHCPDQELCPEQYQLDLPSVAQLEAGLPGLLQ